MKNRWGMEREAEGGRGKGGGKDRATGRKGKTEKGGGDGEEQEVIG